MYVHVGVVVVGEGVGSEGSGVLFVLNSAAFPQLLLHILPPISSDEAINESVSVRVEGGDIGEELSNGFIEGGDLSFIGEVD